SLASGQTLSERTRWPNWPRGVAMLLVLLVITGCASSKNRWVSVRGTPRNPLESTLHLVSWGGPKPTDRTSQVLRRFDLESLLEKDLSATITRLQQLHASADDREIQYSIAELAYIAGNESEPTQK